MQIEKPTVLKKIINRKVEEVSERQLRRTLHELRSVSESIVLPARGFVQHISNKISENLPAVIAEVKKASPSKGVIRENFDPESIAKTYESNGAACLSVLTDIDFFQGADQYLQIAKSATNIPVIRKDFIIDEYQIYEAKAMQADCILLIVAALEEERLRDLNQLANELGLDVLVEVHDQKELEIALRLPNKLIGINNRNLHTFDVDLNTTLSLLPLIPEDKIVVTESGILSRDDVALMRKNNVNSFLVGESFMRDEDPGKKLKELFFS